MKSIKFKFVEFRNFLSYGNTWQKFVLEPGLNLIQGVIPESGRSNGSGKSSCLELLPFALYGKTIKKINKDKIVNWSNKKNCEVRLHLSVDNDDYKIIRGIKPNKLELWKNGTEEKKPAHLSSIQELIDDLIGIDLTTFKNLIYFSPNNTISIINADKPDKRKFLESLFDLSIYSRMQKVVNGKVSVNDKKIALLSQEIDTCERDIERLEYDIEVSNAPDIRKHHVRMNGLKMQVEELEKISFDITEEQVTSAKEDLDKSHKILKDVEDQNKKSVSIVELNQRLIKELGDIDSLNEKRQKIIDEMKGLDISPTKELEIQHADLLQQKTDWKNVTQDFIKEIQTIEKDIAILESFLRIDDDNLSIIENKKRTTNGVCDSCGQEVTEEYIKKFTDDAIQKCKQDRRKHEEELERANKALEEQKNKRDEALQKAREFAEESGKLLDKINSLKKSKSDYERLEERIKDIPDVVELQRKLSDYEQAIKEEVKKIEEQGSKIHMAEIDIERFQEKYNDLQSVWVKKQSHDEKVAQVKEELRVATEHFNEMKDLCIKIESEKKEKEKLLVDTRQKLEETKKSHSSATKLTDYLGFLKECLKDENVKRLAISSLIPHLNTQVNFYLAEAGFPYGVVVDSWLDLTIMGAGVEEISYGSLSGGESKSIDMAVQFACNDIASMLAKTSLNIMIMDEILDSSVDDIGVQSLLDIVRVRQSQNDSSMFVISHRNELSEFTFDKIYRIVKEDGFSRMESI